MKSQVNVKLVGSRDLVNQILKHLEQGFNVIQTSGLRANDGDLGVHVYVTILEAQR